MSKYPDGVVVDFDLDMPRTSAANPRREFDQDAMAALVESIRTHGILQPIIVRYRDDAELEVVCGHRRLAAARAAGLEAIPAIVRHIDAAEAFDLAMTENLQREDLTEIDEAEAYKAWRDKGGYSAEEIALKVGRSTTHVYQRLKLLDLPEAAREAMKDGRLPLAVAVLIGRIPGANQREEATEKVLAGARTVEWRSDEEGGPIVEPMSYQAARKLLVDGYMLTLAQAPFDVNDKDLVPSAGACAACQHRTGNQKDLFGDVLAEGGADVCTYPTCYHSKREAHAAAVCADTGLKRLKAAEMEKAFAPGSDTLAWNAKWVDADKAHRLWWCDTRKKTLRKFLGEHAPVEHAAVDGTGQLRRLYRAKDVKAALEAMKPAGDERATGGRRDEVADDDRLEEATRDVIRKVIVARGSNPDSINTERLLRAIAAMRLSRSSHSPDASHGIETDDLDSGEILKKLKPVGLEAMVVLMAEAEFGGLVEDAAEDCLNDTEVWAEMEKIYGFTLASARKQAQAALDACDRSGSAGAEPAPEAAVPAPKPRSTPKKKVAKKAAKKVTKKAAKKPAGKARVKK